MFSCSFSFGFVIMDANLLLFSKILSSNIKTFTLKGFITTVQERLYFPQKNPHIISITFIFPLFTLISITRFKIVLELIYTKSNTYEIKMCESSSTLLQNELCGISYESLIFSGNKKYQRKSSVHCHSVIGYQNKFYPKTHKIKHVLNQQNDCERTQH